MTKAPYAVTLTQLDDGSVFVQIGCKMMAYTSGSQLADDVQAYFDAPEATIERISKLHGWPIAEQPQPEMPAEAPLYPNVGRGTAREIGRVTGSQASIGRF